MRKDREDHRNDFLHSDKRLGLLNSQKKLTSISDKVEKESILKQDENKIAFKREINTNLLISRNELSEMSVITSNQPIRTQTSNEAMSDIECNAFLERSKTNKISDTEKISDSEVKIGKIDIRSGHEEKPKMKSVSDDKRNILFHDTRVSKLFCDIFNVRLSKTISPESLTLSTGSSS